MNMKPMNYYCMLKQESNRGVCTVIEDDSAKLNPGDLVLINTASTVFIYDEDRRETIIFAKPDEIVATIERKPDGTI